MDAELDVDSAGRADAASASPGASLQPRPLGGLLKACHPGPTAAVTVLMTGMAVADGQGAGGCLLVAAAVLTGQLSVGWSNDAVDAVRDTTARRRTKPVVAGSVSVTAVRRAAITALALCVPLSLAYGPLAGTIHLIGVAAAWTYNLRLKATPLSWLPYAVGFAALPAFVSLGPAGRPWPAWWVVASAALLGVGAHLANVLPDIAADLATGVHGWPQRLGPTRARLLLPLPLVTATALLALARPGPVGMAGATALSVALITAVGSALLGHRWSGLPFLAAIGIAAVDVALLLQQGVTIT